MQIKKLALIGLSTLALAAYGSVFASGHEDAAKEKEATNAAADVAQEMADKKQAEAEAAVKAGDKDAGEKVDEAAAAMGVAKELKEEAAK
jgi:hypothetical protein